MKQADLVAEYYRCLDEDDYDGLRSILHPHFVQYRPDRSFKGRDHFVRFMRTGRPKTDTTHEINEMLESAESLAVYGRLYDHEGSELFSYIDVFRFDTAGRIAALDTYS